MKRGDLVTIAISGDYGKPRPALVVQSDELTNLASVILAPLTSHLTENEQFRIHASAGAETGLRRPSQVMVDKILSVPRYRIGPRIGSVDADTLAQVDRVLAALLGLG